MDNDDILAFSNPSAGETPGSAGAITAGVTYAKAAEQGLHAARLAAVVDRAKSEFLANISHELRTPLNAIIGFSQIMKDEIYGPLRDSRYQEYAADVLHAGETLLHLVNDLLDISCIEIGTMTLDERWCSIPDLCRDAARMVAARAFAAGLKLEVEASADLPELYADDRRVKQILLNLLSNAIKFTKAGGNVSLRAQTDAEGRVVLVVADTGIGIAPDQLDNVASLFGQIQDVWTRSHTGAGLGLPLSKQLAELHGATLVLDSALGVGTTVRVTLPAERTRSHRSARNSEIRA